MSDPYFATGYIRLLCRFVQAEGLSAKTLFRDTGCTEADLVRAEFEMPFSAQMRLCANALTNSPGGLGLRAGYQLQLAAHGALGTAMQSAADLKTALGTFAELIAVRASFFSVSLSEEGRKACIRIETYGLPDALIPFFSESILSTITHCLAFYMCRRDPPSELELNYAKPLYAAAYASVFGDRIRFGCTATQITFDRGLLLLPSPEADPVVHAESEKRCRDRIDEHRPTRDMASAIEHFLLENSGQLWTVDELAPLFAVSKRTLMRRLKERGTTYQDLRDDVLKRQATAYLKSMSVEAAGISLGFADTSSFRRTFKRWFGVVPSDYASHS